MVNHWRAGAEGPSWGPVIFIFFHARDVMKKTAFFSDGSVTSQYVTLILHTPCKCHPRYFHFNLSSLKLRLKVNHAMGMS